MRDYRNYHYSPRERLRYFLEAAVWIALVSDLDNMPEKSSAISLMSLHSASSKKRFSRSPPH